MSEFLKNNVKEVKSQSVENCRNISSKREMTSKERAEAVDSELNKVAEEAKAEESENTKPSNLPRTGEEWADKQGESERSPDPDVVPGNRNETNIKPEKEMTTKERAEAVDSELNKAAEEAKAEESENTKPSNLPRTGEEWADKQGESERSPDPDVVPGNRNETNIKPEKEMTTKERAEAVDAELNKVAEEAREEKPKNTRQEYLPQNEKDIIENDNEGIETDNPQEKKGGRYRDVKKTSDGETHAVHHTPADCASNLERDDGPAIKMEKGDHRQTASYGNSREAREYQKKQKELIDQGKFREALQMDIDDIHEKFGDKYDDAIAEMLEYVDQLEKEGKING